MKVTFEGTIHEIISQVNEFMREFYNAQSKPEPEKTEQKKSVGRPKKDAAFPEAKIVPQSEVVAAVVAQQDVDPTPVFHIEPEPACPTHEQPEHPPMPEDLTAACMGLVNGDKEKKAKLIALLKTHGASTVNGLPEGNRLGFWVDVNKELA